MRQIFFVTLIIMLGSSFCFAQMSVTPKASPISTTTSEAKTLTGKVESVTIADATKGTKSEITVAEDNGNKISFLVKSTATIYDAEGKTISLDKLKKNDSVRVKYTAKEGANEAVSIKLKKQ